MHARWAFLPVAGGAVAHAPVLRFDLLKALDRPMDGGATLRGRRLFGDNKTWRGAVVMSAGTLGAAMGLRRMPWYRRRLPEQLRAAPPTVFGAAVAVGMVAGELPNSFLKRQLGIEPGTQRRSVAGAALSLLDQGDFVLTTWLLIRPVWAMSAREALDAFATVASLHSVVNVVGYAIGARDAPI